MKKLILMFTLLLTFSLFGLLAWYSNTQAQFTDYPGFNKWNTEDATSDTAPPDTFDTAPTGIFAEPNTDTIKFTPGEIDSADWKDIVIDLQGFAEYTTEDYSTSDPFYIPKATALSDSDTLVYFKINYSQDATNYTTPDTTDTLYFRVGTRDSSNNYSYNKRIALPIATNLPDTMKIDSLWTSTAGDSFYVRFLPGNHTITNSWVDTSLSFLVCNYLIYLNLLKIDSGQSAYGQSNASVITISTPSSYLIQSIALDSTRGIKLSGTINDGDSLFVVSRTVIRNTVNGRTVYVRTPAYVVGDTIVYTTPNISNTFNYNFNFLLR